MTDTRFTIIGIALIFAGFLVLIIFGSGFDQYTIESNEFGDCYEYSEDAPPVEVNCDFKAFDKTVFSGIVIGLIAIGVISLIKGIRGKWDQELRPEDMAGPGGEDTVGTEKDDDDDK